MKNTRQEPNTWRELLGTIIADPQNKQRLAEELGIRQITLTRWASGESDPRPQNLRHLISALPQHRELFMELIPEEFGDFSIMGEGGAKEISADFYTRAFGARAITSENMRFWSISSLILEQAVEQLDPDNLGMAMIIAQCMPPSAGCKVRSLRESTGYGTSPWTGDLSQKGLFLGAESLAGYVVTTCYPAIIPDIEKDASPFPAQRVEYEKSSAIYPILYAGRIAGCLIASSAETNHFLPSARLSLLQKYTDLLALAIEPEYFYTSEDIQLRVMPDQKIQRKHFTDFRLRVATTMIQAARRNDPLNNLEAEDRVWRELEEELLQMADEGLSGLPPRWTQL